MWPSDWRRALARIDVRIALSTGLAVGMLVSLVLFALWMRAGYEMLEQLEDESAGEAAELSAALQPGNGTLDTRAIEALIKNAEIEEHVDRVRIGGREIGVSASWPSVSNRLGPGLNLLSPLIALRHDWLVDSFEFPGGIEIEVGSSLADYRRDQAEMARQIAWSIAVGWIGAALLAVLMTKRALAPLVSTTAAIDVVNEARLGARLPERDTDDALDRHVRALNRVLARLEWAFERMRAFSADAAHELRTPVNRLINVTEVALLSATADADRVKALESVRATAGDMQRLVDSLLLLARGEQGRLPLAREPRDLRKLLENLLDLYEPVASERGVALTLSGPSIVSDVDPALFERALGNLLENALRFAPEDSQIRAELAREGKLVSIAIEDAGPGVPKAERARVFERFVRLDERAPGVGSGLGLPIARMIVELHGGTLSIEDGLPSGARLVIHLPAPTDPRSL